MKKILTVFAALAMVAGFASCQKENDSVNGSTERGLKKVTVRAAIAEASKVTYSENGNNALTPAWEENDKILVINEDKSASILEVTEINGNVATLEGEAQDGLAHLVYMEGVNTSSWVSNKIEFSYDNQSGNNDMPAVMLADGEISNGNGEFMFANAGAVLGIYNAKGVPASSAITKVTVSGSNLSKATISINDDALKLAATEKADDAISTATLSGITVTNGTTGALNTPIFIAVPAGAKVAKVTLTVGTDTYTYTLAAAKECNANDYLYIKSSEFKKDLGGVQLWKDGPFFAECNIGATMSESYGEYYSFDNAAKSLGTGWRLPSDSELQGLIDNCNRNWETRKDHTGADINGYLFTGKGDYSSNSIFLPAAGYYDDVREDHGYAGYYWSSTAKDEGSAWYLYFNEDDGCSKKDQGRYYKMPVRAVRDAAKPLPAGALSGVFTVNASGKKVHFSKGNLYSDGNKALNFEANQYSSASSWDASHVSHFYWSKDVDEAVKQEFNFDQPMSADDVFFTNVDGFKVNVGGKEQSGWRTLSTKEWQYLFNTRTMKNGKDRYTLNITYGGKMGLVLYPDDYDKDPVSGIVTDLPDGVVFLPAAGYRGGSGDSGVFDVGGRYWSSSADGEDGEGYAYDASFTDSSVIPGDYDFRNLGFSVRLVTEVK